LLVGPVYREKVVDKVDWFTGKRWCRLGRLVHQEKVVDEVDWYTGKRWWTRSTGTPGKGGG
jgi:hypothetical protein